MKKNQLSSILIFLILLLFFQTVVYATSYEVGVKEGDWVEYGKVFCRWYGDPDETPQYVIDLENIEWIEVNVTKVVESNVTIIMTKHFKNGSKTARTFSGNVETGDGDLRGQVISKGLYQGDAIYNSAKSPEINVTKSRDYEGVSRIVNNANFTIGGEEHHLFWDKETGLLCEQHIMFVHQTVTGDRIPYLFLIRVTSTTAWELENSGAGGSELLWFVVVLCLVILGALLFKLIF